MRVVIAGGGTGGHLFPGIAIAEELTARGHEVLFVGTARGLEAKVVPREGYPLELIDVSGLKRMGVLGTVRGVFRLPRALWQARRLLKRFDPALVIGVGGYASGPVVLAAALGRRPTAILEQNSIPGITNRMLGKVARRVYGAFEESQRFFSSKKFVLAGNPIRRQLGAALTTPREPKPGATLNLLVLGGSQGARAVNQRVADALALLRDQGVALDVVHQTGAANLEETQRRYHEAHLSGPGYDVRPFIDDMAAAYAAADLVVARAGATTIAELTAIGRPTLFIPFPFAADDHQTVNARALAEAGAALTMKESETTAQGLATALAELASDPVRREKMAAAMRLRGKPSAARDIVDSLEALAR